MAHRVGLYLADTLQSNDLLRLAHYADDRALDSLWFGDSRGVRDPIVMMSAAATATRQIRIASAVVTHWTRHPTVIAGAFAALDDLTPGRIIAGIGAWHDSLAARVGITRTKPLLALRETITILRGLLAGGRVTFDGEFYTVHDAEIDPPDRPQARRLPIHLAATTPALQALSGEIADGAILNHLTAPSDTAAAIAQIAIGARKAGRSLDTLERPQLIACALDTKRALALETARRVVAQSIVAQPAAMRASGIDPDVIDAVVQMLPPTVRATDDRLFDAARLIPDSEVKRVTAAGTAEDVFEAVRAYFDAGATCAVLVPLDADPRPLLDLFAHGALDD